MKPLDPQKNQLITGNLLQHRDTEECGGGGEGWWWGGVRHQNRAARVCMDQGGSWECCGPTAGMLIMLMLLLIIHTRK